MTYSFTWSLSLGKVPRAKGSRTLGLKNENIPERTSPTKEREVGIRFEEKGRK